MIGKIGAASAFHNQDNWVVVYMMQAKFHTEYMAYLSHPCCYEKGKNWSKYMRYITTNTFPHGPKLQKMSLNRGVKNDDIRVCSREYQHSCEIMKRAKASGKRSQLWTFTLIF